MLCLLWRYSRPAWTRSCAACCRWPCFGRGIGLDDPQKSLSTPTSLWLCDSVIPWSWQCVKTKINYFSNQTRVRSPAFGMYFWKTLACVKYNWKEQGFIRQKSLHLIILFSTCKQCVAYRLVLRRIVTWSISSFSFFFLFFFFFVRSSVNLIPACINLSIVY